MLGKWEKDWGGGERPLKETWLFTPDGKLTHHKYGKKVATSRYSIAEDTIVVHHKPKLMDPWDETIKVLEWSGREMKWQSSFGPTCTITKR